MSQTKSTDVKRRNMLPIHTSDSRGRQRYIVDLRRIGGTEKFFTTYSKAEAEEVARNKFVELQNHGIDAASLPAEVKLEAARCLAILKPHGVTLTNAVDHYRNTVLKFKDAPLIAEGIKQFLAEKERLKRRPATIKNLRYILNKFADDFGDRQLASLTVDELKEWMFGQTSQRSQINFATKVSEFYNYAVIQKWTTENLATKQHIQRPKAVRSATEFFTIEQCVKILEVSADNDIGLLPYVALGLFAGLRPEEANRLSWQTDVRVGEQAIIIGDQFSKTAQRVIDDKFVWETLAHWLAPYGQQRGYIVPNGMKFQARFRRLKKAAGFACTPQELKDGLPAWVEDGLRHTFATYFLKKTGDVVRTAFVMGNSPKIVHNHYKGRGFVADAERFWNLRPAGVAEGKVVPMVKAG